MRLLLDECVPARLRHALPSHQVSSVVSSTLPIAVLVLDAASNELRCLLPLVPALEAALVNLEPGNVLLVRMDA
jgi:predicted nuclease of predicted toxin-antitoxin system